MERFGPRRLAPEAQARHDEHGLSGYPPGHLALPPLPIAENDRNLDHLEARAHGAVGQLDLEGVALRAHTVEVDRLEHLPPEALEAARQIADGEAQHPAGVGGAALADQPAQ